MDSSGVCDHFTIGDFVEPTIDIDAVEERAAARQYG
jgi:hypothetical protein